MWQKSEGTSSGTEWFTLAHGVRVFSPCWLGSLTSGAECDHAQYHGSWWGMWWNKMAPHMGGRRQRVKTEQARARQCTQGFAFTDLCPPARLRNSPKWLHRLWNSPKWLHSLNQVFNRWTHRGHFHIQPIPLPKESPVIAPPLDFTMILSSGLSFWASLLTWKTGVGVDTPISSRHCRTFLNKINVKQCLGF